MKITYPYGTRQEWYDRSAQPVGDYYNQIFTPSGGPYVLTYSPGGGRRLMVAGAMISLTRSTAPSVSGLVNALVAVGVGGNFVPICAVNFNSSSVGLQGVISSPGGLILGPSDNIQIIYTDGSTGGEVLGVLSWYGVEFDE